VTQNSEQLNTKEYEAADRDGAPAVLGKLVRVVGRILLWGCVLLLLVRGTGAVLTSSPSPVRARAVTVLVPADQGGSIVRER
jgi:hypothetical protein